jgi:hypothetical protein
VKSNKSSGSLVERLEKLEDECKGIVFGSKPEDNTETKEAVMHDKSANKKHNRGGDVIL